MMPQWCRRANVWRRALAALWRLPLSLSLGLSPAGAHETLRMAMRLAVVLVLSLGLGLSPAGAQETLRMAMSGTFRPFSSTDASGQLVGFDADIARELAARMGRRPELIQVDWSGIFVGLERGKFDLICASVGITPERRAHLAFSLPYYVSGAQLFCRAGATHRGLRLGVTEGSTYADFVAAHPNRFPQARVIRYGSEAEIVTALKADKVDAFVSDRIVGGFYLARGSCPGVQPRGDLIYREACGICARPDQEELIREVDQALLAMLTDGTYTRIYRHWVVSDPDLEVLFASWGEFAQDWTFTAGTPSAPTQFAEDSGSALKLLAQGAVLTLQLSFLAALLALPLGALLAVAALSPLPALRLVSRTYTALIRGTPLLVQLFLAYFVVATAVNAWLGGEWMGAFGAALLALAANAAAYNAETLRGAILSIDRGQWDAAASLGMERSQVLRRIIMPQALRNALSSLGNNLVVLIKDTSLVGAITLVELTYSARNVVFQSGRALLPLGLAALFYLVMISGVSLALSLWERHLNRSRPQVQA